MAPGEQPPDVDALVAEVRAEVEERRRAGAYPPGLEEGLAAHFRLLLSRRVHTPRPVDLHGPVGRVAAALPLDPSRIPLVSRLPVGSVLRRAVARLVRRQTQGTLEQVQAFAHPVAEALEALAATVEDLTGEVRDHLRPRLDAALDHQAARERAIVQAEARRAGASRFGDELHGAGEERAGRLRDLVERLAGSGPVLQVGCGRGELLELAAEAGIDASGVDPDEELVKTAAGRGLAVQHGPWLSALERLDDATLGALVVTGAVEHLYAGELLELAALAAAKLRPGGRVLIEAVNPASLWVLAHVLHRHPRRRRPVHPAYLGFLFREAGFAHVDVEWRHPPPERLGEVPGTGPAGAANVARLNRLLFAPQGYLLSAVR